MIELGKIYTLDVGSLAPIVVKTIRFTKKGVFCHYYGERYEDIDKRIFEMNGIKFN
jgi:hypothetical protein